MARKSLVTGRIIHVYIGAERKRARGYYYVAVKQESKHIAEFNRRQSEQAVAFINHILNACLEDIGHFTELTPQQRAAARALNELARRPAVADTEFLQHINLAKKVN